MCILEMRRSYDGQYDQSVHSDKQRGAHNDNVIGESSWGQQKQIKVGENADSKQAAVPGKGGELGGAAEPGWRWRPLAQPQ